MPSAENVRVGSTRTRATPRPPRISPAPRREPRATAVTGHSADTANTAVVAAMAFPTIIPMPAPGTPAGTPLPMLDPAALVQPMPHTEVHSTLVAMTADHFRRCTFRRVTVIGTARTGRRTEPVYGVDCMYGGADAPVALGGLASARNACDSCTYTGRFRADED
jgi:hypothetical protein